MLDCYENAGHPALIEWYDMEADTLEESRPEDWNRVFLNSRSEVGTILLIWLFFFIWVVGVSSFFGFQGTEVTAEIPLVFGFPAWVFWGVAVPWFASNVVTFWFCFFRLSDDPLGEEMPSSVSSNASK